ncbi:hypothetical protein C1I98_32670 [Spongiactinospora gelatinilytica]|uniref:Restriction endonuclease type IV Mrr domain-containing protein n=1 Tax=Spongiactinospora gelatinilytica TaxID=2666298 RepID=A0A2W2F0Z0_9ACTN|nr:pentapeptide repeat-containing protein [Spongiactinospora gelatinilytica]PZG28663.1 hypothetical protein C1I98_32670 [Spongiactinospora gelatinilytica]
MDLPTFSDLDDAEFENFCQDLLSRLGFQYINWRKGAIRGVNAGDDGRDIEALYPRVDPDGNIFFERWFIECKHHAKAVSAGHLNDLLGAAQANGVDVALFMVSGYLSNSAKNRLEQYNRSNRPAFRIKYWEGHDLHALLQRSHNVGNTMATQSTPETRFIEALTRLNHENANVRAGALSLLESVGDTTPEWRQRVIGRVCHYLRHGHDGRIDDDTRKVAQKILTDHLSPGGEGQFWSDIRLELAGAHLVNLDLTGAEVLSADFTGCRFSGYTRFNRVRFGDEAIYNESTFEEDVDFHGVEFAGPAAFERCAFRDHASFAYARFQSVADFSYAAFSHVAGFSGTTFDNQAIFLYTVFKRDALFPNVHVHSDAIFAGVRFEAEACFELARFDAVVNFANCHVGIDMDFSVELDGLYSPTLPPGFRLIRDGFLQAAVVKE